MRSRNPVGPRKQAEGRLRNPIFQGGQEPILKHLTHALVVHRMIEGIVKLGTQRARDTQKDTKWLKAEPSRR